MDAKLIKNISSFIYNSFPEVSGSSPKVNAQAAPKTTSSTSPATFLLTFRGSARTPDGKSMPRIVRVIANAQGRILKVTTSR
ncbi:MAG TPA: hypothetical protein VJ436_10675 [Anaerolineales bacterium]|nr:hypothetical protein [Anaerolineales bacterium]